MFDLHRYAFVSDILLFPMIQPMATTSGVSGLYGKKRKLSSQLFFGITMQYLKLALDKKCQEQYYYICYITNVI